MHRHKKTVVPRVIHVYVIENHVRDIIQDQKIVPDLLESTMMPCDPVKEDVWRILFKMGNPRLKIKYFNAGVYTFWMCRKITHSCWRRPAGAK